MTHVPGDTKLEVDDNSKQPIMVAKMRQRNIFKGTKPALEISEAGAHMLDMLVVTWIFVEHRRRERERRS